MQGSPHDQRLYPNCLIERFSFVATEETETPDLDDGEQDRNNAGHVPGKSLQHFPFTHGDSPAFGCLSWDVWSSLHSIVKYNIDLE